MARKPNGKSTVYLTPQDIPSIKEKLLKYSAQGTSIKSSREYLGIPDIPLDDAERSNNDRAGEIFRTTTEIDFKNKIRAINALQRINDGEFGICAVCESQIPKARLMVIPFAECCVKCQDNYDKSSDEDFN